MAGIVERNPMRDGVNGWGMAFVITKPFRPDQLMAEVAVIVGATEVSGVVVEGEPVDPESGVRIYNASPTKPMTIWIDKPESRVPTALSAALTAHTPATTDPADTRAELVTKIKAGQPLNPAEVQEALKVLLGVQGAPDIPAPPKL